MKQSERKYPDLAQLLKAARGEETKNKYQRASLLLY